MHKPQDVVIVNRGALRGTVGYIKKYSSSDETFMVYDINEVFLGHFLEQDLDAYKLEGITPQVHAR